MMQRMTSQFLKNFILFGLLWAVAWTAYAANVHDVRMWRSPDNTRIVFDLDRAAEHKVFVLQNPNRVVMDIKGGKLAAQTTPIDWKGSPVADMRTGTHEGALRVVFDLSAAVTPKSFLLKKAEGFNDRLVLDLQDATVNKPVARQAVDAIQQEKRDLIIAIDAGHGGEDPGAIGPNKAQEKHVVLAIAKELESLLKKQKGYRPVLLRTGDYYISLGGRRELARKAQADLFISIHADSFDKATANGSSVFALSSRGATSTFAQFLADKENLSDLVGGVSLNDKSEVLSSVLVDLSMTHKQEASIDVGSSILREMGQISRLHSQKVELAAFQVLKTPDIPSVLVETGFISNPVEAKKLVTNAYQKQIAKAIFTGVNEFFSRRAPEGTYVAWLNQQQKDRRYVVSSGDTLSGIASRYSISMNQIKAHNNLASNQLRIGQELRIPSAP